MRDGFGARYARRIATLSLRQRAVVIAVASAACSVGDALVALRGVSRVATTGVALCIVTASALAVADFALRARKKIALLPNDRDRLARRSREAYMRSRSLTWFFAGVVALLNAAHLPPKAEVVLDLCALSFCAVGFALAAFGFWRAGAKPTRASFTQAA